MLYQTGPSCHLQVEGREDEGISQGIGRVPAIHRLVEHDMEDEVDSMLETEAERIAGATILLESQSLVSGQECQRGMSIPGDRSFAMLR